MSKDFYRNIQGRRAGKATRDLHYTQRTFAGRSECKYGLTAGERNLYRKVREELDRGSRARKRQKTNMLMRMILIIKRILGI